MLEKNIQEVTVPDREPDGDVIIIERSSIMYNQRAQSQLFDE